jgi:hypothetical protein
LLLKFDKTSNIPSSFAKLAAFYSEGLPLAISYKNCVSENFTFWQHRCGGAGDEKHDHD